MTGRLPSASLRHMTATRAIVPGRRHAGAGLAGHGHPVGAQEETRASA